MSKQATATNASETVNFATLVIAQRRIMDASPSGNTSFRDFSNGVVLAVDRINDRIGILTTTPAFPLDVNGAAQLNGALNFATGGSITGGGGLPLALVAGNHIVENSDTVAGGIVETLVKNAQTGNNGQAVYGWSTGTANSTMSFALLEQNSASIGLFAVGSYVNNVLFRAPEYQFQSAAGTNTLEILPATGSDFLIASNGSSAASLSTKAGGIILSPASSLVGIATTTPWRTLSVSGTVGLDGITSVSTNQSAYLCLSSNKEVVQDSTTCLASSARFKQNIEPLTASSSLAEVLALNPVSFQYTPSYNGNLQSDPNFSGTYVGFIAEDVAKIDPRLITIDATGTTPLAPHGVRYENITAILAGAIQDIATVSGAFRDNLIAWLADAGNGIENLYAGIVHSQEDDTQKLCLWDAAGKSCYTRSQLDTLFTPAAQSAAAGQGSGPATSTPATTTPDTSTSTPAATSSAGTPTDTATATTTP
jgi:hypothetical protein